MHQDDGPGRASRLEAALHRIGSPRGPVRFPGRPAVLFVCTANVCRSPMACAAFRRAMACAGIDALVDSAGTHSYLEGMPPYPLAVAAAKRRGYDLTRMVARRVRPADFRHFDLIVAMDRGNLRDLRTMAPARARRKLRLLLEFADAGRRRDVEDPYGGGALDFETALDVIEGGCRGLARRMARLGNFDAAPREFADGMRAGAAAP